MFKLNLTYTVGIHIRVNKRGVIARVAKGVKVFEFEIWGWFKGKHLQTKSSNTLRFTILHNVI
jgi:hypothetical protein